MKYNSSCKVDLKYLYSNQFIKNNTKKAISKAGP